MSEKGQRTLQALVLAILGLFLILKIYDGRILLYINQRFLPIIFLAALGLIILSQVILRPPRPQSHDQHLDCPSESHPSMPLWVIWLMALPVIIGVFIPERPLDANSIELRGINLQSPFTQNRSLESVIEIPSERRNILDWMRLFYLEGDIKRLEGEKADITGFVYRDPSLPPSQILVGRYAITCCVADAVAVGIVVETDLAKNLSSNLWVRVIGSIKIIQDQEKSRPIILATQVDIVPEPNQPYLFP